MAKIRPITAVTNYFRTLKAKLFHVCYRGQFANVSLTLKKPNITI